MNFERNATQADVAAEMRKTPEQIGTRIADLLATLLPATQPTPEKSHAYATAWVEAGYVIIMHGLTIITALRALEKPCPVCGVIPSPDVRPSAPQRPKT